MRPSLPRRPSRRDDARKLFVDSGAWIALRSLRDQHHAEAESLFRAALDRRIPLLTTPGPMRDGPRWQVTA